MTGAVGAFVDVGAEVGASVMLRHVDLVGSTAYFPLGQDVQTDKPVIFA